MNCPLCNTTGIQIFYADEKHIFYHCETCDAYVRDTQTYLSATQEKKRYLLHQNDIHDEGYRHFVSPITDNIQKDFDPKNSIGLDFGAGTGPVTTQILLEKGYSVNLYDPFFHPDTAVLQRRYDFIICCETMEHFFRPDKEFALLKSLLNPGGKLYCMTDVYRNQLAFSDWYYKNDPTHVFIYTEKTLEFIKNEFGFKNLFIQNRLIVFEN